MAAGRVEPSGVEAMKPAAAFSTMGRHLEFTGTVINRQAGIDYIEFVLEEEHKYGYGYTAIQRCIMPIGTILDAKLGDYITVMGKTKMILSDEYIDVTHIIYRDKPQSDEFLLEGSL